MFAQEKGCILKKQTTKFSKLFLLLVLRPVVYSKSSFLAKVALSLYGLVHSVTVVHSKRLSAVKSLLNYAAAITQKKLKSNDQK
jgi:hypothetical protein